MEHRGQATYDRYSALLGRHRGIIWRMCLLRVHGDPQQVVDLVQDVSVALWQYIGQLRPGASRGEEWAWVVLRTRAVLHQYDARHRHLTCTSLEERMVDDLADSDNPARQQVEALLALLPEPEAALMRMHLEGYTFDEIGARLGLTLPAVKSRMHRTIQKMKQLSNEL